jgi:acyl-CoA dehydrogenase
MNFDLTEEHNEITELATRILDDHIDIEVLNTVEESQEWFDRELWEKFASSGLTGATLKEDVGGAGLDIIALVCLLRSHGQHVAPIPLLPTLVSSMTVDKFGTDTQRNSLLPGVATGSQLMTFAVQELLNDKFMEPTTSHENGVLTGKKIVVEYANLANSVLVTAMDGHEPATFVVDLKDPTITMEPNDSTRGEPLWDLSFNSTPCEKLGGEESVSWLFQILLVSLCATQLGVTETALKMTASYTSEREQFGRPLATFQAVTQRLADQFINVRGIRLTTFSAAWRLSANLDALEDTLIAKWWASERATEIAHATQHCHGGMGVSKDYPLYRYTLWNKHITTSLGAGTQTLRSLGSLLASN